MTNTSFRAEKLQLFVRLRAVVGVKSLIRETVIKGVKIFVNDLSMRLNLITDKRRINFHDIDVSALFP